MLSRLTGCFVFAGLIGVMIAAVSSEPERPRRDVVAAAEIKHRVQQLTVTRP